MDAKLHQYLHNQIANHLLPFYWQHGDHYERIPEQIERIAASGCRALCVESRPHKDFCGETWWRDMDAILSECAKRDMKVWILDDNHFPTGNANGLLKIKYPELRKWHLVERHIDLIGPMQETAVLVDLPKEDKILLGAFAYPRHVADEILGAPAVDLSDNITDGQLLWNVPEGCWRMFFFYKSRAGSSANQQFYIDMMNPESVAVLLEAVYEPHYQHYKRYFGNTLAGFFSDEPSLGNQWFDRAEMDYGMYNRRVGMPGLAMPWHEEILKSMDKALSGKGLASLAALWYDCGEQTGNIRLAYMDAVTRRYSDCFVKQLGDWCRARGVEYIGHIIEDMNAHGRLGCSAGHYFRSQDGQDMSGMDVVLHQVMPGLANFKHTASAFGGYVNPEFFQYTLPKLCSSAAHLEPKFKGHAMCEVFGAFGWAEGSPFMKWLMDFLLVRGINQFVPHAFSPAYPDPDCPPHFGAEGHDPQFPGFTKLMGYTNRVCHLLDEAQYVAQAAILYHAEAEWMSRDLNGAMLTQKPAKVLMDNQIGFDIVPADALEEKASVCAGKLRIYNNSYKLLIVPSAPELPPRLLNTLAALADAGLEIWFIDQAPANNSVLATIVPLAQLSKQLKNAKLAEVTLPQQTPTLRHSHWKRGKTDIFLFVNESLHDNLDSTVALPCQGECLRLDVLEGKAVKDKTNAQGTLPLQLAPFESCVVIFNGMSAEELNAYPEERALKNETAVSPVFSLDCAASEDLANYKPYGEVRQLFNVTAKLPRFSGNMRYTGTLTLTAAQLNGVLDLGQVGQTAHVWLNGVDCGLRICPPYTFSLQGAKEGDNTLVVEIANTLAHQVRDWFSFFMQIPPSGLLGPLKIKY